MLCHGHQRWRARPQGPKACFQANLSQRQPTCMAEGNSVAGALGAGCNGGPGVVWGLLLGMGMWAAGADRAEAMTWCPAVPAASGCCAACCCRGWPPKDCRCPSACTHTGRQATGLACLHSFRSVRSQHLGCGRACELDAVTACAGCGWPVNLALVSTAPAAASLYQSKHGFLRQQPQVKQHTEAVTTYSSVPSQGDWSAWVTPAASALAHGEVDCSTLRLRWSGDRPPRTSSSSLPSWLDTCAANRASLLRARYMSAGVTPVST